MAKISDEARLEFNNAIQPYKDRITQTLEKEKTMLYPSWIGNERTNTLFFSVLLICLFQYIY